MFCNLLYIIFKFRDLLFKLLDLSRRKTLYGLRRGGKEWSICDSSGMCWYSIRLPIFEERVFLHESGMVILEDRVIGIFSVHVDVDVEG